MLRMIDITDSDDPSSRNVNLSDSFDEMTSSHGSPSPTEKTGLWSWLQKKIGRKKADTTLRAALEEIIEEAENSSADTTHIALHERALISNVAKLRDTTVVDVMIPRADIMALDVETSQKDLLSFLSEQQFSRIPIYRETLDDVIGTIHIKDILACLARGKQIIMEDLIRDIPIVSPSMPILDLILLMRQKRKHMTLVVDEYGGIDGLVTIGDVIESIIGEVDDEYDNIDDPEIKVNNDGSLLIDARLDIEEFEKEYGQFLKEEEREDIDTLGGLIFAIAGRIPGRGEILSHPSGLTFEIIDADPRRVNKVLVKTHDKTNTAA